MGNIGPRQQRFEVLPAPAWGIEDVLAAWQVSEPVREVAEAAAGPDADDPVRLTPRER